MWVVFLLLLLPLSVHAEDLGELSANPAGFSDLFSLSGYLVSLVIQSANRMNETNQTNKIDQFVSPYGAEARKKGSDPLDSSGVWCDRSGPSTGGFPCAGRIAAAMRRSQSSQFFLAGNSCTGRSICC